jgi:TolA-binding protein
MAPLRGRYDNPGLSFQVLLLLLALALQPLAAAQPDETGYFSILQTKFDLARDNYAKALPEELILFRRLFPQSAKSDSVEYMLGVLFDQNGQPDKALASFIKILYLYPACERTPEVIAHIRRISTEQKRGITALFLDENLKLLKQQALRLTEEPARQGGGERGYYDFLQFLADAKVEPLARYVIDECVHYLYQAGYSHEADRVLIFRGDMFRLQKDFHNAILSYAEAPLVTPQGKNLPLALLRTGDIYFRSLKDNGMARNVWGELLDKYPASLEAGRGSIFLAEVEESEKNYGQAITRLEEAVLRYPFPEIKAECYARIGRIYMDYLASPDKAIASYKRTVDEFPAEPGAAEALIRIGGIHESRRYYRDAVDSYRRLAELFPGSPVTAEYLFRAAELSESKLKDTGLAGELYKQVSADFPATEFGKKARKKTGE